MLIVGKCINVSRIGVVGGCVQQFCWKREVSKKKRDVLRGMWHKREREEFTAKSHWGASQVTWRNSFVSGGIRVEKCYVLSTCCMAIESSIERPCAEEKTLAEK